MNNNLKEIITKYFLSGQYIKSFSNQSIEVVTSQKLHELVKNKMITLKSNHVKKGSKVAICLNYTIESMVNFLSLILIGAIPFLLKEDQIKKVLQTNSFMNVDSVCNGDEIVLLKLELNATVFESLNNIVFIQFTSGTLGRPKGVPISEKMLLNNLEMIKSYTLSTEKTILMNILPLSHDMGLIGGLLSSIYNNHTYLHYETSSLVRNPKKFFDVFRKEAPTNIAFTDFLLRYMIRHYSFAKRNDFKGVKVFIGAEPIKRETIIEFIELYKEAGVLIENLYFCYGLAEAVLLVAGRRCKTIDEAFDIGPKSYKAKLGEANFGAEVSIQDQDQGGVGKILIRGKSVFQGYYTEQGYKKTEPNSYFDTGDRGYIDENKELIFCGRYGDSMVINGNNVFFEDIETIIKSEILCHTICSSKSDKLYVLVIAQGINNKLREEIRGIVKLKCSIIPFLIEPIQKKCVVRSSSGKLQRRGTLMFFLKKTCGVVDE